jgi:hypothetical protein
MTTRLRILAAYIVVMGYFAVPARADLPPQCAPCIDDDYNGYSSETCNATPQAFWWFDHYDGINGIGYYLRDGWMELEMECTV